MQVIEDFEAFWCVLPLGKELVTPDKGRATHFVVAETSQDWVRVRPRGGASITISKAAFIATLRFLVDGLHYSDRPCLVASSIGLPGTLGYEAKKANASKVVVIPYVLPILKDAGLVEIDSRRPNQVWLL